MHLDNKIQDAATNIENLLDDVFQLQKDYRNKSAHVNVLSKSFARRISIVLFISISSVDYSQHSKKAMERWRATYRDFVLDKNIAYVVTDSGKVVLWNLDTRMKSYIAAKHDSDKVL